MIGEAVAIIICVVMSEEDQWDCEILLSSTPMVRIELAQYNNAVCFWNSSSQKF